VDVKSGAVSGGRGGEERVMNKRRREGIRDHIGVILLVLCGWLAGCADDTTFEVDNQQASVDQSTSAHADIAGKVVDVNGAPIVGAVIVTTPYGRGFATAGDSRRVIEHFVSDANGEYSLPQQALGSYNLKAMASGYQLASRSVANIDFLPQNLLNGVIQKDFVLQAAPREAGGEPAVALFDIEDKKRMTEFLTTHNIRWTPVVGTVATVSRSDFRVLVIGHDATVYTGINELITHRDVIDAFIAQGGHLVIGQINDFSFENQRLSFLLGERSFQLHTENAPFNDFFSAVVVAPTHPLIDGVSFNNWNFIEPGQKQLKQNIVFDAAVAASFTGPHWQLIVRTPAVAFSNAQGTVNAQDDVVIAEYRDPVAGGRIVVNQGAYFQGAYGDLTDPNAVRLSTNLASYLKSLNQ
jgi:hypothetical protein